MNFTENAKSKFWADLSAGIKTTFNHNIGEAFHIDQYKSGRFTFTESVVGGPGAVTILMDKIKESSPAIKSVRMSPISSGYNATYNVSVDFDPMIAESVYSDGKTALASIKTNGKDYIVHNDGSATEVDDADKYVANLNKTTGSKFKKEEDLVDNDGMPLSLEAVVELANQAIGDTGATITMEDDKLVLRGSEELVKPTQEYLPTPYYGSDVIEGGYNDETGDLEVCIPEYPSEFDMEQIRSFLISAVNCIIDYVECSAEDTCEDDEWVDAMADAEPDPTYASQYAYKGESFVGTDKSKVATLVKSLMDENYGEACKVASKFMGKELAEGLLRKYATEKVEEAHSVILSDEMEMLDKIHESAMGRAPEKEASIEKLVEKNMHKKEDN